MISKAEKSFSFTIIPLSSLASHLQISNFRIGLTKPPKHLKKTKPSKRVKAIQPDFDLDCRNEDLIEGGKMIS